MNRQPKSYLQADARWGNTSYSAAGESTTIGKAGCGPTSAAMLIATLKDAGVTPATTAAWALAHGYKACKQGTYYSYFAPQFRAYGIACTQLNAVSAYHNPKAAVHTTMLEKIQQGYYVIALMKKGTWTSSGHFIVLWWADGTVHINDPASTAAARINGNLSTFLNEAAYYWAIDARAYNGNGNAVSSAAISATMQYKVVAKNGLNLRDKASNASGAKVLAVMPYGTKLSVSASVNGWAKVTYNGMTGWCSNGYLLRC